MHLTLKSRTSDPDGVAAKLIELGRQARTMPRSFDAAGVTYKIGSDAGVSALWLPGRGIMPLADLKTLGIRKQPPYVYDPSRYRRIEEGFEKLARLVGINSKGEPIFGVQGAAISTYDGIIAARANGKAQDRAVMKTSMTTTANVWYSLFQQAGAPGAGTYLATTAPTDAVPTLTTAGALSFFNSNPAGSDKFYLLTFGFTAGQQINMLLLVDILNHAGKFRLSVNTAETVASPTNATRVFGGSGGIGNLLTAIVMTAGTPGAGNSTFQYIDQGGVATNAPVLTSAAAAVIVGAIWPASVGVTAGAGSFFIPLDPADTGVQAVKQHTASVAGTGELATNVFFPVYAIPGLAANAYVERDSTTQIDGLTELANASQVIGCLAIYVLPNTTSTGALTAYSKAVTG